MNASKNTAQIVDFENNATNKLVKQSKSAKGRQRRVTASTGTKVSVSSEHNDLRDRQTKAANRFTAIQRTQRQHLEEMKNIGDVILETRNLFDSDKEFGQAVEKTPLKAISRQDRYVLMKLAENWDKIQTAIKDGKMKSSTSAKILTDQYRSLLKANEPKTPPKGGKVKKTTQSKTESPKSSAKQKSTDETSSQDLPKAEWTEDSVAVKLVDIVRKNDLDVDLIFDKVLDLLEAKSLGIPAGKFLPSS
jgi:hypothetical protein